MPVEFNHPSADQSQRCGGPFPIAALLYFCLATGTILLTSDGKSHATVWLADAVILALLLCRPKSSWPLALILGWAANLAANAATREWAPGIILYGAINMAQVLLAAWALRRCSANGDILENGRTTLTFLFWAGFVAPAAGAVAGSAVSAVNYGEPFVQSLERWYLSNALGIVVLTPFLKSWFDGSYVGALHALPPRRQAADVALLLLHGSVCAVVFAQNDLPLLFTPLCSLLVLAFFQGRLATQAGVVMVGLFGAVAAIYHIGPIALIERGPVFEAAFFQAYLGLLLVTTLPVAALVASRAEAFRETARREELLRMVLEHSPDAILSFDEHGICQLADGSIETLTGLTPDQCRGSSIHDIERKLNAALPLMSASALASPGDVQTADLKCADPDPRTLEVTVKAVAGEGKIGGTVATIRDVSAQRAREREIARLAMIDPLTGIANRAGLNAALARLTSLSSIAFLALVDIDNFKEINDRHGHKAGDQALVELAASISALIGDRDHVARMGGDEFAILVIGDAAEARRVLELARRNVVALSLKLGFDLTISGGLSELRSPEDIHNAFEVADRLLYRAKRSGRNRIVFEVS